jgi:Protein SET DOMAIN GROUP 2 C-terminal
LKAEENIKNSFEFLKIEKTQKSNNKRKIDSSQKILINLEEKKSLETSTEKNEEKKNESKKRTRPTDFSQNKRENKEKYEKRNYSRTLQNYIWLADIFYFYAFTHTYFRFAEYNRINSESIEIRKCEVSNVELYSKNGKNSLEDDSKIVVMNEFVSYKNDFILGQLDKWFRQDNIEKTGLGKLAGRFVYPNIKYFADLDIIWYPFQKHQVI